MFPFPSSRICFLIYILSFLNLCSAEEVDVKSWMCMDEKCSVPISSGKAAKKYGPPDHANKIAVTDSEKLEIMRIPADPTIKYYYVKTKGGKEGLLLKSFVREDKLIKSSLVKVELTNESSQNKTPDIRPSAPTNVIDGTTLPPHEDPPHQYAPTLAQGQMNDVGTHSVVQSTTPPSDIDQPSSSVNSSESNNSRNASEGEPESKDTSYAPKQAEGQMNDAGTHSDVQSPTHSPFSDQSSSNVNSSESKSRNASEEEQESKGTNSEPILSDVHPIITQSTPTGQMTASGIGISSTPESTISNDSSQFHDVPHDAIVVSATSSIHVGPDSTQIQKSQTHENVIAFQGSSSSEVGNGTSVDDVKSDTAKEGESFLENVVNHVTATLTSGDTDSVNSTSEQTTVLQDDSPSSTPDESATPFGSSCEQVEADANIKNFPESNHINFVDKKVFTVDSDSEKKSSDHGVEQMKENDGSSAKLSSELSGYGSAEVAQLNSSLDPALVGKLESDYDSEPPQNVSVKQGISSEANSDTVGQQILDAAQFINEDKNMTKSDESVFNSSSPNDKGSSDASSSQTSNSDQDSDVGIEEVLADSEEFVSNINVESSKIGPSHSGSDETLERTRSHTPPDNVRSDFYKMYPRTSVQGFSSSTPSVRVPEVASGTTAVPPTTQSDETIPQSIVDVTTAQTSSPSELPEPELPPVSDANAEVLEVLLEEPSIQEESSNRWYSSIVSIFASVQEMFSSTEAKADISPVVNTPEVTPKFQVDEKSETCTTDTCESQPQLPLGIEKDFNILIYDNVWLSHGGLALMMITAIAVLLFSLGYYYLENLKRDVELVNKYNDLAGKLFIEQKEKEMLAEQLTVANESMSQISFDTTKYDEEISDLKALVHKYKEEKTAIEEKEKETRKKFMMVDKNYNELRNILSQNKQKGERSALILDIKNLKESIASNNIEIASLKEQLLEKKEEIKSLNARIMEVTEANKQLEGNVEKAISDNHKIAQKYQDNIAKLEQTIEESTVARVKLEKECTQLKKECESLVIEKELAESSLQKFQRLKPSVALTEWLDAKEVRVSLLAAKKKIEELTSIRDELTREKTLIEEKERTLVVDFEQLNEKYERAEKDKIEALTKLQVLSDYFKEKETQLQEELGTKESLWLQKQSDDRTIYEQMRALREENASFKNQNETLKREILDQEASFKKLITSAEEKAHENWVALRHQERRLKEAQMEAAQLRSRLTVLESAGDISDEKMSKGEVNGEMPPYGSATSPPFMLYPEFVPPPPLLQTTPSRPPPLGRISSPPLGDFTPPPPLVPYEMFLPPSPPPPAPHVLHKPQPLDGSHRIQKDSQSSNHSSESAPDRTRRNRR